MLVSFTGSFDDLGAAKEAAYARRSALEPTCCSITPMPPDWGVPGCGAITHLCVRRNGDQNAVGPDNLLASAVTHIPKAFVRNATEIKSGEFRGGTLEYGMKEGMVEVVYNPRLQSKIPAATLEKAKGAEQQIIAGKIVLE